MKKTARPRGASRNGAERQDRPLEGKVALVTGAGVRVGRAIARELAAAGADVVVHYHSSGRAAEASAHAVEAQGSRALLVRADLTQPAEAARLVAVATKELGRLDVLVCSAAGFERKPLGEVRPEDWQAMIALNLSAPFFLAQAAAPALARHRGVIVNILDVAAFHAWKGYAAYSASKAGLAMLTRCLALELAPRVRVAGVAPGTVQFPADYRAEARAAVLAKVPLGRAGRPEDVARAVRFIVENDYITGSVVAVDGGRGAGVRELL